SVFRQVETSWVSEFFKIPVVYDPGTHFLYSSALSFMKTPRAPRMPRRPWDAASLLRIYGGSVSIPTTDYPRR
ncbi:MAG: hypothetical protein ACE10C_11585, partial [Candidatus Binatia bacterium]